MTGERGRSSQEPHPALTAAEVGDWSRRIALPVAPTIRDVLSDPPKPAGQRVRHPADERSVSDAA